MTDGVNHVEKKEDESKLMTQEFVETKSEPVETSRFEPRTCTHKHTIINMINGSSHTFSDRADIWVTA